MMDNYSRILITEPRHSPRARAVIKKSLIHKRFIITPLKVQGEILHLFLTKKLGTDKKEKL